MTKRPARPLGRLIYASRRTAILTVFVSLVWNGTDLSAASVDFEKDIRPIFSDNCLKCHGPEKQKAGFRVDQRAVMLAGGDSGHKALIPGDPQNSPLIRAVRSTDPDTRMPPKGERLSATQLALLENWIAEGALWPGQMETVAKSKPDLWSLKPVTRPTVPKIPGAATPIDAFLLEKLGARGLAYNPPADPRALIRRASVLLTGLQPTPERVERFVADTQTDGKSAYVGLIEELLASPHFGERWAQHWLDVIRWAETNGSEANLYRKNAWTYRDYVIRALNEDRPYDRFVREQLAGDQLGVGEATGFLVAGPHVPPATVGQEPAAIRQARADRLDEIVQTIGASVLGMTVGCARCHNHKFDPISIRDYYALSAVFQGVEFGGRIPEQDADTPRMRRTKDLLRALDAERAVLGEQGGQWEEDWGGFREMRFPATKTSALRIDFDRPFVVVDELEIFGPKEQEQNLASASAGTKLVTDESMIQLRGEIGHANDGEYGTQSWKSRAKSGSKDQPWVEIRFPESREVSRFRFSSNREYYFEVDYLADGQNYKPPGYRISARQADGTWKEIGSTKAAKQALAKNERLEQAAERLRQLIARLGDEAPSHGFIARFQEPAITRVLRRGSPETPGEEVAPAGFAVLDGDLGLASGSPEAERRKRFADWVTRPTHPLAARVMVNRVWHHVFGAGIVTTTADFGRAGAPPSHPELLDWLADEFVKPESSGAQPWGIKDLLRRLLLTDAFRQSSAPREDGLRVDTSDALLWRFAPRRVEAEVIRDSVLQASGNLDPSVGGRSFRIHNVKKTYAQWEVTDNHGPGTWRRMIYQERMRRVDDQIFSAFDFPDCGQVRAKRPVSTTPLQALNLMNSPFVVEQSKFLAERARKETTGRPEAVRRSFELLLGRRPSTEEAAACQGVELEFVCRTLINSNEYAFLP